MSIKPFTVAIPQVDLEDLQVRLRQTRWPDQVEGAGWDYGTNLAYLQELTRYWAAEYNWRTQEAQLNAFPQYTATVEGTTLHFIHHRGKGKNNAPLVLLHGWPGSFVQMTKIIPLLVNPAASGDSPPETFDVIVPSLPGYGFSGKPTGRGMNPYRMAQLIHTLLTEQLGYGQYVLRGSDIGAGVAREMALSHPEAVLGLHLSGSNPYVYQLPADVTDEEKAFVERGGQFLQAEGAYALEQSTKPQTLAYGLQDSPVGLAAWLLEKFRTWSDCGGDVESRFTRDELLTQISLYWFTGTIGSSMRVYYEGAHHPSPNGNKRVEVPTAMLMLGKDIARAPRSWETRFYTIQRWNEYPRGGHFGEWEEPRAVAADIRAFVAALPVPASTTGKP